MDDLYGAENKLLQSQRVIPLLHLRTAYGVSNTVRNWKTARDGSWRLPNVWLGHGETMIFRRKLLAVFALTVLVSVVAVAWSISSLTRRAFEKANEERTAALVAQFRREFNRRGEEVVHRVETIAASEGTTRMALALSHGSPDYGAYLNEARTIADNQQLDFLEFIDSQGTIISSAQWPAKFGYKETLTLASAIPKDAFLKQEELPDGAALGLFAVREVNLGGEAAFRDRRPPD